ncbi:hypothetical protein EJ04DRAFT_570408 [Polyplosphaeria fusca]|uniref:RING-type domain-containing protein n=1 Tax=Polyplosphaeria fusca TaxID=682080 RepID=A0A9P4QKZ3_9PLEO|nr:hypothetical protein EJ04DRAFT_570408 [Polyplosphaeria fusca]
MAAGIKVDNLDFREAPESVQTHGSATARRGSLNPQGLTFVEKYFWRGLGLDIAVTLNEQRAMEKTSSGHEQQLTALAGLADNLVAQKTEMDVLSTAKAQFVRDTIATAPHCASSAIVTNRFPPPETLPSLMRFTDNILMRSYGMHDNPPGGHGHRCPICYYTHQSAPLAFASAFVPLPCNHWVHYRCIIHRCTRVEGSQCNNCPTCKTKLFEWEGISVITVATRSHIEVDGLDYPQLAYETTVNRYISNEKEAYLAECEIMEMLIRKFFNVELGRLNGFDPSYESCVLPNPSDGSPNLIRLWWEVLEELSRQRRPWCRLLQWKTHLGWLLFGMFVAVKIRRWVIEDPAFMIETNAWSMFEDSMRELQTKISQEIHGEA